MVEVIERYVSEGNEIQLQRRDGDYEIIYNGVFLMSTGNGKSERELVRAALSRTSGAAAVLIGGLGVGYSVAECLKDDRVAKVVVVEREESIIAWNQKYTAMMTGYDVQDARLEIVHADIVPWVKAASARFDVVCLDIDNGPDWTVTPENDFLYSDEGLDNLSNRLNPGGVVSFWSASRSVSFLKRLQSHFDDIRQIEVAVPRGEPDCIYVGMGRSA